MAISDELLELFRRRPPRPGPGPDPASLLQFVVELEKPELTQAAIGAYLNFAVTSAKAQLDLAQSIQQIVGKR